MIIRLTAPNWERPSPYDGSHIIMSISDIYQSCINSHIITFLSRILIPVAQYIIFPVHITSPQYTCAAFDSSALTDGYLRTFSLYSPGHVRSCTRVFELGHVRRALHICPEDKFEPQCTGPTTLHLNIDMHPTIREQQVYTSNITFKDKDNRVKHQYIYIYLDCYTYTIYV